MAKAIGSGFMGHGGIVPAQPVIGSVVLPPNSQSLVTSSPTKKDELCEACGRGLLEKSKAVRAQQFFETIVEMFDAGQIKQFVLTPADGEKLKLMLQDRKS